MAKEENKEEHTETRSEFGFVIFVSGDEFIDEGEKLNGFVIDLDVDVEVNGLILWSHQEFDSFAKSWNLLMRCFVGAKLIETSVIILSLNSTRSVRRAI